MDVFAFRDQLITEYERFSRSFAKFRAEDIRTYVNEEYAKGRFWPAPLIQINPHFVSGGSVDELVAEGLLDPECAKIFRIKSKDDTFGKPMVLHQHQRDAIEVARKGESYVLTTGTGSGKSLSYFIPIVDDVLRRKRAGTAGKGITAIVVYPMNALCNSQLEELEKYLRLGYGEGNEPVTFARYTGQESEEQRKYIASNPPDILLTNYVMLELLMTRADDTAIRNHAHGLRFLVLDELHTYRGRQGADVAMLVRRVRERFNENLLCIGTSATMASEGSQSSRNEEVASVASRLFGAPVKPENIITESLRAVTVPGTPREGTPLADAILAGLPTDATYEKLAAHPVAAWVEFNLGLDNVEGKLVRILRPKNVEQAAAQLAKDSGLPADECQEYLTQFLLIAYNAKLFAFRLHQFISGAGHLYATLEPEGKRFLTVDGQQFQPGDREKSLFNLVFCRNCGQEYYPVWADMEGNHPVRFYPRELWDKAREDGDDVSFGFFMPDTNGIFDPDDLEKHYPEDWLEYRTGEVRLGSYYRRYRPIPVHVSTTGSTGGDSLAGWFTQGSFRLCLHCGVHYDGSMRSDLPKLSSLSTEGRSSATTVLAVSALRYLMDSDLDEKAKKLLGFTDNRQDASLQAGHFNDFIQVLLLRGALLAAIHNQPDHKLRYDRLTDEVFAHLGLTPEDYAANPGAKGLKLQNARQALLEVLGYRLYIDLRRGWRLMNPNLEQLELLEIRYAQLKSLCEDEDAWKNCHPLLRSLEPDKRHDIIKELLDEMRRGLCIKSRYLDASLHEQMRNRSFNELREPWGLSEDEKLVASAYMVPHPRTKGGRSHLPLVHLSHRSRFGRKLKDQQLWGIHNEHYPKKYDEDTHSELMHDLLTVLSDYGYVDVTDLGPVKGYRVDASALEWCLASDKGSRDKVNQFFRNLYENVAALLQSNDRFLHQLEAREHTAQVEAEVRAEREMRFRKGAAPARIVDGQVEARGLPVLFCSPTMELGVDISTLNTVYMRNVPPTPANYAQRSGRAGRSGQPALVITYCAAGSPHDQYFFADPTRMVAGAVKPPTIDLANEDLIRSHLHAVWLAETGEKLGSSVRDVLDLSEPEALPLRPDLMAGINEPTVRVRTTARAEKIMKMLSEDVTAETAPWYTEQWLANAVGSAPQRFNQAFQRWRSLYKATSAQMAMANSVLQHAAASEQERRDAKARYDEAYAQQRLLLDTKQAINSDFYTYRYLASEGFLPGYNFPRLPLIAYIPARRERVVRDSFLSRPRFLGLSEFGPQSIIYHEGSTYRVRRAILTIRDESSATAEAKLPVQQATLCPACGYAHFGDQQNYERCVNCDQLLGGGRKLPNLYRIEQVATRRAMRITSDEEDRQRLGYEMITTLRFAEEDGVLRYETRVVGQPGSELVEIRYGPSATLWRINLGWRRRANKSIYGFTIDVHTGEWTRDSQAPTDAEDDQVRDGGKVTERITPYVEDTKNVLVLQSRVTFTDETSMATLQYALKRGIEKVFQLEESELAAEPLPTPDNRKVLLFYESAEGGAGVLTRLATDADALQKVAKAALEICHYQAPENWKTWADWTNTSDDCEAGCYRCLLSYYNQPDHPYIDRRNEEVREFLAQLALLPSRKAEPSPGEDSLQQLLNATESSFEREWLLWLRDRGHRLPDRAQQYLPQYNTRPDFAYTKEQTVIYIDGSPHENPEQQKLDQEITERLTSAGITVIRFTTDKSQWPIITERYNWIFGPASSLGREA